MIKEKIIYSKWLAYELRKNGFKLIKTDINKNYPQYITWIFIDSEELQKAITQLTKNH